MTAPVRLDAVQLALTTRNVDARLAGRAARLAGELLDRGVGATSPAAAFAVPGRIELIGKHVDYAGGRSLTCATDRSFVLVATPRSHASLVLVDIGRGVEDEIAIDPEVAEKSARHCVMLENCCYGRREMTMLSMVRAGLLGELLHAEGAYIHDLRSIKFSDRNEGLWRLAHSMTRNGNLYPSHGIGPIAQRLDIGRGDRMTRLVSMSSPSRGLSLYAEQSLPDGDPRRRQRYALGDINTSLIQTARGRSIMLQHDTTSPRPYRRIDLVQGTKGTFGGYPDRIHIEGRSPAHEWEDPESYREEWDHPLWREVGEAAEGAGHGGKDYLEDYRLVRCLLQGTPTDMDVYDAAAWSVLTELSERSVTRRAEPVDIPDFTRGSWRRRNPLGILTGGRQPCCVLPSNRRPCCEP